MATYKGGYDNNFHIRLQDAQKLLRYIDAPFRIKTNEGWLTATHVGGRKLRLKDISGEWITITRFGLSDPHPVLWIIASDQHDIRDGNVWEVFAHEGIGPSLASSPIWYDYNTYDLYVPTANANDDFYRIKTGVNGHPGFYCDSNSGVGSGYQQLLSFWRWWDPAIEESAEGVYSAYTLPSPEVPRWRKYLDLVDGYTIFFVFSIGSTSDRHGVSLEISQASGSYSDEPYMLIEITKRIGTYPYDFEIDVFDNMDKPSNGAEIVNKWTNQGPALQSNTIYVGEVRRDSTGNISARINGTDITIWDFDVTESYIFDESNQQINGNMNSASVGEAKFVVLEALSKDTDLIYETKIYSGALTGAALQAERDYFSSKYGVST